MDRRISIRNFATLIAASTCACSSANAGCLRFSVPTDTSQLYYTLGLQVNFQSAQMTLEAIIRTVPNEPDGIIFNEWNSGAEDIQPGMNSVGSGYGYAYFPGNSVIDGSTASTPDTWYDLASVYDGSSEKMYVVQRAWVHNRFSFVTVSFGAMQWL